MTDNNSHTASTSSFPPSDWVETTLGEVCEKIGSGSTPRGGNEVYKNQGISLIRSQNVLDFDFSYNGLAFIDDVQASLLNNVTVLLNDILINITGDSVARVCMVPENVLPARVNQHVSILRTIKQSLFQKFLKYYLLNPVFKNHLLMLANSGGTRNALTKSMLESLSITLPPLPEQQAIASVLSVFDEKIELLQEQNKTLEEMGQVIFREWFGKYGADDELPEGWRVGKIKEIIKREPVSYKCDKKDLDPKGETPIIDQGANGLYGYTSRNPDFIATKENPVILFTNHTCNYWFIDYPFCAIQNILPYRGKDGYDEYFLYFMTKGSITFIEYKGHWPDFEAKDFIIPPVAIAQDFSKIAKPILEKISDNNFQIQSLARSRDELLPRLMRGEVRVEF